MLRSSRPVVSHRSSNRLPLTAILALVTLFAGVLHAQTPTHEIKLAWEPSPGANGYFVYFGSSSGTYVTFSIVYPAW